MKIMKKCAYSKTAPTGLIPACDGETLYVIREYYVGAARKAKGPDMFLCDLHGKWLANVNPAHAIELIEGD